MVEQAEFWNSARTTQLRLMQQQVTKFEETGEIWELGDGALRPPSYMNDWAPYGGPAAYIAILKERLPAYEKQLQDAMSATAAMRHNQSTTQTVVTV